MCGLYSASAFEVPLENWQMVAPKESLVKMQLHGNRLGSSASSVTWTECASEHLYDIATGTANPNPPQVGSFVSLNLDLIFNADANVDGTISQLFSPLKAASHPLIFMLRISPQAAQANTVLETSTQMP
jgi:hypothetical protein